MSHSGFKDNCTSLGSSDVTRENDGTGGIQDHNFPLSLMIHFTKNKVFFLIHIFETCLSEGSAFLSHYKYEQILNNIAICLRIMFRLGTNIGFILWNLEYYCTK